MLGDCNDTILSICSHKNMTFCATATSILVFDRQKLQYTLDAKVNTIMLLGLFI
jgi:hypothetical protein